MSMMNDHERLLASLEHKLKFIRVRTTGVAEGWATGFYLFGEGGTSKSYTVEETLKDLGKPYKVSNSRITGKGLFELLRDFPDMTHLIEDAETLFADKKSFGVLRSALWGQESRAGRQERLVVWQVGGRREEFIFTGGIILVANCRVDDIPQLRAMKTRISTVHHHPTNEEVAALMWKIASKGHHHEDHFLAPADCLELAHEIIERCERLQKNLDIRVFINSCKDRLQWVNGQSELHWLELLESRMKEASLPPGESYESRAARANRELDVARRIAKLPAQEQLEVWKKETGKSRAAMYRRLSQLSQFPHASPPGRPGRDVA
jgi:hypothetical protein